MVRFCMIAINLKLDKIDYSMILVSLRIRYFLTVIKWYVLTSIIDSMRLVRKKINPINEWNQVSCTSDIIYE
jgi:hypothetical protein